MLINKLNLNKAISTFLIDNIIPSIPEKSVKIFVGTTAFAVQNNPDLLMKYIISNPLFSALVNLDANGNIELTTLIAGLKQAMETYGNVTITIGPIPMLMKNQVDLTFSPSDVDALQSCIERCM